MGAILILAFGLSREGSVVGRKPLGLVVSAAVALWRVTATLVNLCAGPYEPQQADDWQFWGSVSERKYPDNRVTGWNHLIGCARSDVIVESGDQTCAELPLRCPYVDAVRGMPGFDPNESFTVGRGLMREPTPRRCNIRTQNDGRRTLRQPFCVERHRRDPTPEISLDTSTERMQDRIVLVCTRGQPHYVGGH